MRLKTERLILKPIDKDYAGAIFNYRSNAITNKYQGWIPKSLEDVFNFIKKTSSVVNIENTWFQFVIIKKENAMIIGDLGIHFLDAHQAEIGCTLAKDYHGKGYAFEALEMVIDYLFKELNKHRIIGSIDPRNIKSINLLEKLGFRREAHFKGSILVNGEWMDDLIYAILKKEWS